MRLRNIPGSRELISENDFVVHNPEQCKGKWHEQFQNSNPIHIEIGMGKGQFLLQLAEQNPDINYIGIEKYSSVLLRAIQKLEEHPRPNIKFIRMDAEVLTEVFDMNELERIYLNFSDPWPKDRHCKRRLTSKEFFSRYDKVLQKEGRVEFKSDNDALYTFSLEEVLLSNWRLDAQTFDLHHTADMLVGNVMTEYEEKFSALGHPIHKLIASR